jgi:multiple sugar transport system permease protein
MTKESSIKVQKSVGRTLQLAFIIAVVAVAAFPLYWMLNTALTTPNALYKTGQDFWLHLENFPALVQSLGSVPVLQWLGNSAFIATGTTIVSLLLGSVAGYALSRFRFYGKGIVSFLFFTTQVLPEALILVPLYALFISLGLINNLGGLVLANAGFAVPVATFIIKNAMDSVPFEIEESARVDDCPRFSILTMILLPLITPSLAAAAVIAFFSGWNEFLFANTFLLDKTLWPASVGLASFVGQYETPLSAVMGSALIFSIPAVVFFLLAQRKIVSGLTAGAVKG